MYTRIFLALWTSALMTACAVTRAPSLNMLEQTADYDSSKRTDESLGELKGPLLTPYRTEPEMTDIMIHPHEMPTGDYFLGGWIRVVLTQSQWEMDGSEKPTIEDEPKK
ncbi:MAG: hypothetical protein AB7T49_06655 [Oligoflexales bacterium]